MFRNTYQKGFLSIFYSLGNQPLQIWQPNVKNGHIKRLLDEEVKSIALEIMGTNVATTYITAPKEPKASLAIRLPFLVMLVKNMRKFFTFEIQILDDRNIRRRFRLSNFQSSTKVQTFCTSMPLGLSPGWNQIQFNLADFTRRAYGTNYIETVRVQIHANIRIRRIYFTDHLYTEEELPPEFRMISNTSRLAMNKSKMNANQKRPEARQSSPVKVCKAKCASKVNAPTPVEVSVKASVESHIGAHIEAPVDPIETTAKN